MSFSHRATFLFMRGARRLRVGRPRRDIRPDKLDHAIGRFFLVLIGYAANVYRQRAGLYRHV